mmetsp:Transcript_13491/g.35658  ORF Transcript_13491/g.35658 Transcript_13491/m.35658 type:complete len:444 (+) Transcript_13491:389-1720(+)
MSRVARSATRLIVRRKQAYPHALAQAECDLCAERPSGPTGNLQAATTHYRHELLEVEAVVVDVPEIFLETGLAAEHLLDLRHGDFAVSVHVEHVEGLQADVLLEIQPAVERRRKKLAVFDHARVVKVDDAHDPKKVFVGDGLDAGLHQAVAELVVGQGTVAVAVHRHERLAEAADLAIVQLRGDDLPRRPLEQALRAEPAEVVQEARPELRMRWGRHLGLEPGVAQRLLRREAVLGIHLQKAAKQVLGVLRDRPPPLCREADAPRSRPPGHRLGVSVEGGAPAEHEVHDHAAAPQVAHLVVLAGQHLRGDVVRRSRLRGQDLVRLVLAGQPEVDDLERVLLDGVLRGEEEVLGLQVAVAYPILVHVVDGADDLLHDGGGLDLREVPGLDDAVEQLASCAQLHHKIDVPVVLEAFEELDDVGMVHHLHDGDLLLEAVDVLHLRL